MAYGPNTIGVLSGPQSSYNPSQAQAIGVGASYTPYDPTQSASTNAQNMVNNQNANYASFMQALPQIQNNMNNQTTDQGLSSYNNQKQAIDQNANARGLLFSGMKTGAEASAANTAANNTQNQIAANNQNLQNYATGYGNQVAQSNIANYQGNQTAALQSMASQQQANAQQQASTTGLLTGLGTTGAMLMFSDKKLKDNIKSGDKDALEMLDKTGAKKFTWKDDKNKKEQLGVLAQDLEKSNLGKSIVIDTPKGKAIDVEKALSAIMATQSALNKKLNEKDGKIINKKDGGYISGKEIVHGNSVANDTRTINASPGEVILDKETLAGGPRAWAEFIHSELEKHQPELLKKCYPNGGTVPFDLNSVKDPSNILYQDKSTKTVSPSRDINKSDDERLAELNAIKNNLPSSYYTPSMQQEYSGIMARKASAAQQSPEKIQIDSNISDEAAENQADAARSGDLLAQPKQSISSAEFYRGGTVKKEKDNGKTLSEIMAVQSVLNKKRKRESA